MASLELRNGIWHIRWRDKRGKLRSQSTKIHTSPKNDKLAAKRLIAFERDLLRGKEPAKPLTVADLLDDVIRDYETTGKSSVCSLRSRVQKHLKRWFGSMLAQSVNSTVVREYQAFRQKQGASNATINRELDHVKRGFTLAKQAETLDTVPYFPSLEEAPPRAGFFEPAEFEAILARLPEHYRCPIQLERITGWRTSNIRSFEARCIDWVRKQVRLDPGSTKNDEGPVCPLDDELASVLQMAEMYREIMVQRAGELKQAEIPKQLFLYEYKRKVRPIGSFRKAWIRACYEAGIPCTTVERVNPRTKKAYIVPLRSSRIPHDFRRTAVRDWSRMIGDKVAMTITGHRTREVFDRYNIVSESDLDRAREARNRLFAKRSQSAAGEQGDSEE